MHYLCMTRDESDVKSDTFVYRTGYRLVSLRDPIKEIWFVGGASLNPSLVSSTWCVDWLIFARHNAERHSNFHRPPTKLQEGNVFTGVCLSTGGVYARSQVLSGVLCLVPSGGVGITGSRSLLGDTGAGQAYQGWGLL